MSYKTTTNGGATVTVSDTFNDAGPVVFLEVEIENVVFELDLTPEEAVSLADALLQSPRWNSVLGRIERLEQVLEAAE